MKYLILLCFFLVASMPLPPEKDPECMSEYVMLYDIPNCKYCNEQEPYGHYYLYACKYARASGVQSIMFKSQCIYTKGIVLPNPPRREWVYLPLVRR